MDVAALDAVRIELAPGGRILLPISLGIIMMSVALNLHLADFAIIKRQPVQFLGAMIVQVIGLPLVTLALVHLINPVPSIALGMIVVACCPGGNVSNFLTHLARGDTALSVSLTATSSLAAALLTPVSILFWTSLYGPADALVDAIEISPGPFIVQTTLILAIPLIIGMVLAHRFPKTSARVRPGFTLAALAILIFLVVGGLSSNWALFTATAFSVLIIAMMHNALAFALGAGAARVLRMGPRQRRSLTFEAGIQNTGLALVILLGQFEGLGGAAAITALWSVWHLFAGGMLAGAFRLYDARKTKDAPESAG
jgi:BASS family bile acid:Na+ symporter